MPYQLNVAVVEPSPTFAGGSERIVLDVSRQLVARGHRCFLVHDYEGTMLPLFDTFIAGRVRVDLRAFGWRTFVQSLHRAWMLAGAWRAWRTDVVLCADIQYLRLLALAGALGRVPVVFHLGLPNWLPYPSQRLAMRTVAGGVVPSRHMADSWRSAGWPADTLHLVPNGVDNDRFRPTADRRDLRRRLGLREAAPTVLFVGRLVPQKGLHTLFAAISRLRYSIADVQLVVVGSDANGSIERWEREATAIGLSAPAVKFTGRQDNPEDYLAAADMAVVPSEWEEPFGLTALESIACGAAVVVSNKGVMPDLVAPFQDELVFASGDPEALEQRLRHLLQNPTRLQTLAARLQAKAVARYSATDMGVAYERVLINAVERRMTPAVTGSGAKHYG